MEPDTAQTGDPISPRRERQSPLSPPPTNEAGFHAEWEIDDTAHLHPANLPIARAPRAWERRPLPPVTRRTTRVGKVWKRAVPASMPPPTGFEWPGAKRGTALAGLRSPAKPIKKLRMDGGGGIGVRVSQWEDAPGSPARKIVTRSAAAVELLALPDEDAVAEAEDNGNVTIEFLDSDGNALEGADLTEGGEWSDVDDEDGDDEQSNRQDGMELMHLIEAVAHTAQLRSSDLSDDATPREEETWRVDPLTEDTKSEPANTALHQPEQAVPELSGARDPEEAVPQQLEQKMPEPDNVVSPEETVAPQQREQGVPGLENALVSEAIAALQQPSQSHVELPEGFVSPVKRRRLGRRKSKTVSTARRQTLPMQFAPAAASQSTPASAEGAAHDGDKEREPVVANLEGPQSSSTSDEQSTPSLTVEDDVNGASVLPPGAAMDEAALSSPELTESPEDLEAESCTPVVASSVPSAEEHRLPSPEKSWRHRLSDDTELLQAFLDRAAENKSSRRKTAAKRKSLENRRESDTVRQALASPTTVIASDVLGELDPNSPSSRKPTAGPEGGDMQDSSILSTTEEAADPVDNTASTTTTKTRRSGRGRKKPEVLASATNTAPSRITIRGPAGANNKVRATRTEAQELAALTRSNTRKNKGNALFPLLKLMKMTIEAAEVESDSDTDVETSDVEAEADNADTKEPRERKRGVTWAETLTSFCEGPEAESSGLSDALEERAPPAPPALPDDEVGGKDKGKAPIVAPPPAVDTPSKPNTRRLKPARMASTPAKVPAAELPVAVKPSTEQTAPPEEKPAAAPKVLRSRITTSAKDHTDTLQLPAEPNPAPTAISTVSKGPTPRKKPASKLPAPTTSALTLQGKENLIASPPKKKPTSNSLPAVRKFTPKPDFHKTRLQAAISEQESAPSLASPAKKGRGRRAAAAVSGNDRGVTFEQAAGGGEDAGPPGLKSPAKKRATRRTAI